MKYGYARVSKDEQNPAMQLAALEAAGCHQMFTDEGMSGAVAKRPALSRCLKALQPGDTLTVWKARQAEAQRARFLERAARAAGPGGGVSELD